MFTAKGKKQNYGFRLKLVSSSASTNYSNADHLTGNCKYQSKSFSWSVVETKLNLPLHQQPLDVNFFCTLVTSNGHLSLQK